MPSCYLVEKTAAVTILLRIVLNSLWSEEEQTDRQQIVFLMLLWLHSAILARMVHLVVKRWRIDYLVTFFIIKLTRSEERQENALRFGKLAKFQALQSMFHVFKPKSDELSQKFKNLLIIHEQPIKTTIKRHVHELYTRYKTLLVNILYIKNTNKP